MVNRKLGLGILVMVLVFGMTVVGNLEAQTENGGEFILTDLPAKYNGKYVSFGASGNTVKLTTISEIGEEMTLFPIINGKVIIPLWVYSTQRNFERYSGNDTFAIKIYIFEKEDIKDINTNTNKLLEAFEFDRDIKFGGSVVHSRVVQFSNGSATRSYKDKSPKIGR